MSKVNFLGNKWGDQEMGTSGGTVNVIASFNGFSLPYENSNLEEETKDAFELWGDATNIEFNFPQTLGNRDVNVGFGSLDGKGGILGVTSTPKSGPLGNDQRFESVNVAMDSNEQWETNNVSGDFSFSSVMIHEIGHVMGLRHSTTNNSIMTSTFQEDVPTIQYTDVEAVQELYGDPFLEDVNLGTTALEVTNNDNEINLFNNQDDLEITEIISSTNSDLNLVDGNTVRINSLNTRSEEQGFVYQIENNFGEEVVSSFKFNVQETEKDFFVDIEPLDFNNLGFEVAQNRFTEVDDDIILLGNNQGNVITLNQGNKLVYPIYSSVEENRLVLQDNIEEFVFDVEEDKNMVLMKNDETEVNLLLFDELEVQFEENTFTFEEEDDKFLVEDEILNEEFNINNVQENENVIA